MAQLTLRTWLITAIACLGFCSLISIVLVLYHGYDPGKIDVAVPSERTHNSPAMMERIKDMDSWATRLLGSQVAGRITLAGIALLAIAIIVVSIVIPIFLAQQEELLPTTDVLPAPNPKPEEKPDYLPPEPTFTERLLSMSVLGQVFGILGAVFVTLTVVFGVWNAVKNWRHVRELFINPLIQLRPKKIWAILSASRHGIAFLGCAILSVVALAIGSWQAGVFNNLILLVVMEQPAFIWLMVGIVAWIVIGVIAWIKNPNDDPDTMIYEQILATLSFSLLLGAMGSIGGWWTTGFSVILLVGFVLSLRSYIYHLGWWERKKLNTIIGLVCSSLFAIGAVVSVYFAIGAGGLTFSLALLSGISIIVSRLVRLKFPTWCE